MRAKAGRMAVIVVATAFGGAAAAGDVEVRKSYYGFSGASKAEIKASVIMNGPRDGYAWGLSTIDFVPQWRTETRDGVCRPTNVHVGLAVDMRLPRWRPRFGEPPSTTPALARHFVRAVERHEYGHVSIARRFAAELARRLSALRSEEGCWRLRSMAASERQALMARHLAAHRAYDDRTRKGLKALLN